MNSIFCEAYKLKDGHKHVCTKMADHKDDHECLCDRWPHTQQVATPGATSIGEFSLRGDRREFTAPGAAEKCGLSVTCTSGNGGSSPIRTGPLIGRGDRS